MPVVVPAAVVALVGLRGLDGRLPTVAGFFSLALQEIECGCQP